MPVTDTDRPPDVVTGTSDPVPDSKRQQKKTANPYADLPDAASFEAPANNHEGTYRMRSIGGGSTFVPYSAVARAIKAGYTLSPEDQPRFTNDISSDPNPSRLFPDLNLLTGVKVTGVNAAGQPIFGPKGTGPEGSGLSRYGRNLWNMTGGTVIGTGQQLMAAPSTPTEQVLKYLPAAMAAKRLLFDPARQEFLKAVDEWKAAGSPPAGSPAMHRAAAAGHALAAVIPMLGPGAAQMGEQLSTQLATGDYAGAAGALSGLALMEEGPKVAGKFVRGEIPGTRPLAAKLTEKLPHKIINQLIKPGRTDLLFGKDPAQAVLREGIVANSLPELGDLIHERLGAVGQTIDDIAQHPANASKVVNVSGVLKPLEDEMEAARKAHNTPLYDRLRKLWTRLNFDADEYTDPQTGVTTLKPIGVRNMRMSPEEALKFKRTVGDMVSWTNDPLDKGVNRTLGKAYRDVKDALNREVPELRSWNERYADLVEALDAVKRQIPVDARHAHWSLMDVVIGSHSLPLAAARKIARTTGVRTRVANSLYTLPQSRLANLPVEARFAGTAAAQVGNYGQTPPGMVKPPSGKPPHAAVNPYADLPDASESGAVDRASAAYNVNPNLIRAVIGQESGGNPGAVSPAGATGMMQLMPDTAKEYGVTDPTDPDQNVMAGTRYLRDLIVKHNNNIGEALKDYYGRGTPPPGFPSTDEYAQSVLERFNAMNQQSPPAEEAPAATPKPSPVKELKTETAQRNPRTSANKPNRKYQFVASSAGGHKIGSDDGTTWFDIKTGQRVM